MVRDIYFAFSQTHHVHDRHVFSAAHFAQHAVASAVVEFEI